MLRGFQVSIPRFGGTGVDLLFPHSPLYSLQLLFCQTLAGRKVT